MHILETNTNCAMSQPVSPLFGVKEGALRSQVEAALLRDVYMASKAPQAWPTQAQVSASVHHPPDATFSIPTLCDAQGSCPGPWNIVSPLLHLAPVLGGLSSSPASSHGRLSVCLCHVLGL